MALTVQEKQTIRLFDQYSLMLPRGLRWHADGQPGNRVIFITDPEEKFLITFEEGMQLANADEDDSKTTNIISHQCFIEEKCLHQRCRDLKIQKENGNYTFFCIEWKNSDGSSRYLPGQMTVKADHQWSDGVEPVLIDIVNGISLCYTKDEG